MAVKDYLDPRWQRVRLRIMERDKFECQACLRADKTLHVHHKVYEKKKKIWDASDSDLGTLCEECHARCEKMVSGIRRRADEMILYMSAYTDEGESPEENFIESFLRFLEFNPSIPANAYNQAYETVIGIMWKAADDAKAALVKDFGYPEVIGEHK